MLRHAVEIDISPEVLAASVGRLAAAAGLSKAQARKHVHALIADGLVLVIGNAFGGAPGSGPTYTLNSRLLAHLADSNPDLFAEPGVEIGVGHSHSYRFEADGVQFLACLMGRPSARRVVFWRVDGPQANYGDVPLRTLLTDSRVQGGWHCHLLPNGDPDVPFEQMHRLKAEEVATIERCRRGVVRW